MILMTQKERRRFLIQALLEELPGGNHGAIPAEKDDQRSLLRGLLNMRRPGPVSDEFLEVQNEYLQAEIAGKGIKDYKDFTPVQPGIYLWRGDITRLRCDAIVNAANSKLLGCFCPNHDCIDNTVHSFSGVQLRAACAKLMEEQGHDEPVGCAKLTPAFNLPCEYILHTVGPTIDGEVTKEDEEQLASCYRACLELAKDHGIKSLAFCCISTGEYHFPHKQAAQIAIETVKEYRGDIDIIFNTYQKVDYEIYKELLD